MRHSARLLLAGIVSVLCFAALPGQAQSASDVSTSMVGCCR